MSDAGYTWSFLSPSPPLAEVVSNMWIARWRDESVAARHEFHAPPDASVHLLFRLFSDARSELEVRGPTTAGARKPASGAIEIVGMRLRLGMARRVLGVAPERLVDRAEPFDDPTLAAALTRVSSADARMAALADFVIARHRAAPPLDVRVARFLETHERGGLSDRHLQRLARRETGLSPKQLERVGRFFAALEHLSRSGSPDTLATVAQLGGYADQAHFAREFKEKMKLTPGQWIDRRREPSPISSRPVELAPPSSSYVIPRLPRNSR